MKQVVLLLVSLPILLLSACGGGGGSAASSVPAPAITPAPTGQPTLAPPAAPTGVSITPGDAQAQLSWAAVGDATNYNVYYRDTAGVTKTNSIKLADVTSGSTITSLVDGMTYHFVVTAVNADGESATSSEVSATPSSPPGSWATKTPMVNQRDNAANAALNGKIYVLGGAPAGLSILDSMEMYDPATDTWTTKATMPPWSTFATVPPWAPGGTSASLPAYRYGPAVAPVNGALYLIGGTALVNGQSPIYPIGVYDPSTDSWSATVPSNPATTLAGTAGQALAPFPTGRWGFDVAVVDGIIYAVGGAKRVPGNISKADSTAIIGATSTTPVVNAAGTTITGLKDWNHYYFFVTAVDATTGIESAPSFTVSALLRNIWAAGEGSAAGDGQATVTWMETAGATSYNLYYSTQPGVTPTSPTKVTGIAATPTTATATVTGLSNGTPYYFIATAMTPAGEVIATSEEISVTPQLTAGTSVPSGVTVSSGAAQATLSWTPVANAASYNIYYGTNVNIYHGTVEAYDPVANTWTSKATMPTPRWGSTVSVVDGLIYAIGGWGGWPELSVVEVYDPVTDTWSTTVPVNALTTAAVTAGAPLAAMPTARDDFGFSVVNGIIYAIGGDINAFDDVNRISCCTTVVEAYNPVTNSWSTKTAMPTIRDDFDASVVDGVIYAIAGSRDGMFTNTALLSPSWLAANNGGFSLTTVEAFSTSSIPVPNGLTATTGTNQTTLNWNAVPGATSYNIYWSNKSGVSTISGTKIASVTSPYVHSALTPGKWYYYVVTAVTAAGESLPSNEVAIKP